MSTSTLPATTALLDAPTHGVVALEIAKCNDPWVEWRPVAERTEAMIDMIERAVLR